MNPEKWKSVVIRVDDYVKLKAQAQAEHRTISGQFTHALERLKELEAQTLSGGKRSGGARR
jgi:hypothetical protein|tara:strand:+ start:613 stop:795 length:183 start_codon:yes stop_codon:yes gene_type:complete